MAELLTPLELDFLWESLGAGELPYPLEARSHGETMDERASLRKQVLAELGRRGVLDESGRLDPRFEDWVGVLSGAEVSLDAVHVSAPHAEAVRAVAAALGNHAVLAVQDGRGLHLQSVPADGLASAIIGTLPAARRGTERSITVPLEQLVTGAGADFMQRRQPSTDGNATADEDRKALARLHAQPRLRGGQIGANARNRVGGRVRTPVLSWFDTEAGRYLTQASRGRDGREWITIAPADVAALRQRLNEMLSGAVSSAAASY
ncbi:ESX secretion-associated protein EspG [Amycolatopsis aidingensis]|uniref:ESX secretion-associated protein EspG n=1 Tax=Amycolatopsis aidingensis TaxID=2842453 RepID=UPI001C0B978D|nr:ESX secretion-associated protein EspG [Amycolatopsis aidingensis]